MATGVELCADVIVSAAAARRGRRTALNWRCLNKEKRRCFLSIRILTHPS